MRPISPRNIDPAAVAHIARRRDVIKAAAAAGMPPASYVRLALTTGVAGLVPDGLGGHLGMTFDDVMGYYKQYKQITARPAPTPAPVPIVVQASPPGAWYGNPLLLLLSVGLIGAVLAFRKKM